MTLVESIGTLARRLDTDLHTIVGTLEVVETKTGKPGPKENTESFFGGYYVTAKALIENSSEIEMGVVWNSLTRTNQELSIDFANYIERLCHDDVPTWIAYAKSRSREWIFNAVVPLAGNEENVYLRDPEKPYKLRPVKRRFAEDLVKIANNR